MDEFGLGKNIKEAYLRAVTTDPVSYFGGIVGFNREVDTDTAKELVQPFLECIIAPSFSETAIRIGYFPEKRIKHLTPC